MDFSPSSFKEQLVENVLPFWLQQIDIEQGGFFGEVYSELTVNKEADKTAVLMTRYLWALSAAYSVVEDKKLLDAAKHVFKFLHEQMLDEEDQGIYWSVTYDGQPKVMQKHVYAQSFAIYGLSEFYKVSKDKLSLDLAVNLFELIEEKAYINDLNGYQEEFNRHWQKSAATLMGPRGEVDFYTTNVVLHLLEAYTNLYQVFKNEYLLERIQNLLHIFAKHIVAPGGFCYTVFKQDWTPMNSDISHAHDIETAWLLYRTLEVIEETDNPEYMAMINRIVAYVQSDGLDKNGIIIDKMKQGIKSSVKQWWSLAESVIGFYDAYERVGDIYYQDLAIKHWKFIQSYLVDPSIMSEWIPNVDEFGQAVESGSTSISDGWKGPYHTVRMYVEMIKRLQK